MGSPVSVTVANLVMEDVEERALTLFPSTPPFWKKYIDDTYTALRLNQLAAFHEHCNSVEPSIDFTYEVEEEGIKVAFSRYLSMWVLFLYTVVDRVPSGWCVT